MSTAQPGLMTLLMTLEKQRFNLYYKEAGVKPEDRDMEV